MQFLVTEECRRLGLRAGTIFFRNLRIEARSQVLADEIRREAQLVRTRYAGVDALHVLPEVTAFQERLRRVGVNPRRDQPSVERLLGYALKRGDLPAVNNLVDAYNLVSIRSLCSLGAHDLDLIDAPISLHLLSGLEIFTPLGSSKPLLIHAGEFGYVDARGRVLCRLDVNQADFSKVTRVTRNALLIVEGTTAHAPEHLQRTMEEVIAVVIEHCGGSAEVQTWPG
jgi:DNA/RNA-binding domain of Phe-tRNA-synthetase-like protein